MRRKPVPKLRGVGGEIEANLPHLLHNRPPGALVAAEAAGRHLLPLPGAARDRPQQQVGHVDGDRLRQAREAGGVVADAARVARCC